MPHPQIFIAKGVSQRFVDMNLPFSVAILFGQVCIKSKVYVVAGSERKSLVVNTSREGPYKSTQILQFLVLPLRNFTKFNVNPAKACVTADGAVVISDGLPTYRAFDGSVSSGGRYRIYKYVTAYSNPG